MRWAFVLVAVGACSVPQGLELDVVTSDPIARVELIPATSCETCPAALAAPGTDLHAETALTSTQPTRWTDDVVDGHAQFRLVSDSGDESFNGLVVLGFDANDMPVAIKGLQDVTVPGGDGELWQIPLSASESPVTGIDDNDHSDGRQVAVWHYPDQSEPSCVMVDDWSGGQRTSVAIMPPGDPDCDHQTPECVDNVPNANVKPELDVAQCGAPVTLTAGVSACELGGQACTDGKGPEGVCTPFTDVVRCLPEAACHCTTAEPLCAASKLLDMNTVQPNIECVVPFDGATGKPCNEGTIDFDLSVYVTNPQQCTSVDFLTGFFTGAHTTNTIPFGASMVTLSNLQPRCIITITISAGLSISAPSLTDLVDIGVTNGLHLVMPFRLTSMATNGCLGGAVTYCAANKPSSSSETIYNCGR